MTTTTSPYTAILDSPAAAELQCFQAGLIDTFPQTGWEKSCARQSARRDAERDARWTAMRAWLEHWAESARATMREYENSGVRFSLALCQTALDEMTRLEQSCARQSARRHADAVKESAGSFLLYVAEIICPRCGRDSFPDNLDEAIDWALGLHEYGKADR